MEENEESLAQLYEKAWKKLQTKCSDDEECKARVDLNVDRRVPHYIVPGSEEEWRWVQTHPKARVVSPFSCLLSVDICMICMIWQQQRQNAPIYIILLQNKPKQMLKCYHSMPYR